MKNKSINQVSIINGEDGPTSVFIFGREYADVGRCRRFIRTMVIFRRCEIFSVNSDLL